MNNNQQSRNNIPFIEIKDLSFSYDEKNLTTGRTLNNVSFFVNKGERIAILGHNGSGKSTLAKILGGIFLPDEGEYFIDGVEINKIEFSDLHKKIGMVFQDPENQIVAAMVEDDVAFAPENQGLQPDEIQARVDEAIKLVEMTHKQDSPVAALSGGEKQRIALAGALAADIECLILDEATSMLDPENRSNVEKILKSLHKRNMTIIQITHNIEPDNFDDIQRVIVLSKGKIKWSGTAKEFWNVAEDLGFNDKLIPSRETRPSGDIKFKISNLSFMYDEKNYALRNINAEIFSGQWLSIIGKSGSGKSTLVQHLNALFKIQNGTILFDGVNLPQKGKDLHKLRQRVGLVFQMPEDQLFCSTVKDELAFAPKNAGFRNAELEEAILYGLECVGLEKSFLERSPLALSGGERRLVAIASVLSAKPECIVLDEPLAGLDASYKYIILTMLGKLCDNGHTVITVTHDLEMALSCSDRILTLQNGECIKIGRPNEF